MTRSLAGRVRNLEQTGGSAAYKAAATKLNESTPLDWFGQVELAEWSAAVATNIVIASRMTDWSPTMPTPRMYRFGTDLSIFGTNNQGKIEFSSTM